MKIINFSLHKTLDTLWVLQYLDNVPLHQLRKTLEDLKMWIYCNLKFFCSAKLREIVLAFLSFDFMSLRNEGMSTYNICNGTCIIPSHFLIT